jgi:hypothetical protein
MKEFLLRELHFEKGDIKKDGYKITATRCRTSSGYGGISIKIEYEREGATKKQELNINTETLGNGYESIARDFADTLNQASMQPCELPKPKANK